MDASVRVVRLETVFAECRLVLSLLACLAAPAASAAAREPYDTTLLPKVRAAARAVPGEPPLSLHYLEFGETNVPESALVEAGAPRAAPERSRPQPRALKRAETDGAGSVAIRTL